VRLRISAPFIQDLPTGEPFISGEAEDACLIALNEHINADQPSGFALSLSVLGAMAQSMKISAQ
jgi:hypothetical protein